MQNLLYLSPPSHDHLDAQIYQYRLGIVYAIFDYGSEALNIYKKLIRGPSMFNWKVIKYDPLINKFLGDNAELNKLISNDEKKYRSEAKH